MTELDQARASKRRPDRAALFIALILAGLGGLLAWNASQIGGAASYARIGPATFPYVVAAGLLILALWTLVAAIRGDFPEREHQELGPVVWIVGGLVAQMLLIIPAGFSIATGLLFAATAKGFGRGPLWLTIPIGIVFSFIVWFIFARLLQLTLPAGPLERLVL